MSVVVKYIGLDNNSAELAGSEELNGKAGERTNYHIAGKVQKLTTAGYVLINNSFDPNNEVHFFDETSQEYKLTFRHGQEEVTIKNPKYDCQLSDVQFEGKQAVHYTGLEKDIPDNVVEVTFNRKIIYDKVTKQKVPLSV